MRFKIKSKKSDGTIQVHTYDNHTQEIFTEKGIPVSLNNDPRTVNLRANFRADIPIHYTKDIKELRVQLGLACNFHCKYCIEGHNNDNLNQETVVAMPPKQTAENFVKLLKDNDITAQRIIFWGGEPLVYWKTIQELVPRLEELYKDIEGFGFGLCTNGSLLDVDKVKYMLEHNMSFSFSHDGWSFNAYRGDKDPLDNPKVIEALQYYYDNVENKNLMNFNVVITPENCEVLKLPKWFEEKVGRPIHVNIECIVKNDRKTEKIVKPFDEETKKTLLNHLFYAGVMDEEQSKLPSLRRITSKFMASLVNKRPLKTCQFPCGAPYRGQVAVDLQGNVLRCHGTDPKYNTIGHLSDIESCINDTMISSFDRTNCLDCPFLTLCAGGCPMLKQEDLDCYCKTLKLYYSAFFAAAWKLLFDGTILSIETLTEKEETKYA